MILAVTVGSESCDRAVDQAANRADARETPLRIVYVADTSFLDQIAREVHGTDRMEQHLTHIGRVLLRRAEKRARVTASVVETEVLRGDAREVLPKEIGRQHVDEVYISRECLSALAQLHDADELEAVLESTGATVTVVD